MPSSYLQQLNLVSNIADNYIFPISDDPSGSGTLKKATFTQVQTWADNRYLVASGGLLTFCSGLPISTGVTGLGNGVSTFLTTPSSQNLASAITDETGNGLLVFNNSASISGICTGVNPNFSAGTNSQGQGQLSYDLNVVSTVSSNPGGCTLPSGIPGKSCSIVNFHASNPINVYPLSGESIDNFSTNAAIQVPFKSSISFICDTSGHWHTNAARVVVGGASNGFSMFPTSGTSWSTYTQTGAGVTFWSSMSSAGYYITLGGSALGVTSGTYVQLAFPRTFNPTSGTGIYTCILLNPTINQTGGASGITRAIYINPTLTASADFRAIDVVAGSVLFGSTLSVTGKTTLGATDTSAQTYTPSSGSTATLDCSLGNVHEITMPTTGNVTIALSNVTNNQAFEVSITWAGSGTPGTVTWFSTIRWNNGTTPTQTAVVSKRDRFLFRRTGSGTYDGFIIGQNI